MCVCVWVCDEDFDMFLSTFPLPNAERDWMCLNNLRILVYASLHRTFNFKIPLSSTSKQLSRSFSLAFSFTCLFCKKIAPNTLFPYRFERKKKKCNSQQIKVLFHHSCFFLFIVHRLFDCIYSNRRICSMTILYVVFSWMNGMSHGMHKNYNADRPDIPFFFCSC